MAERRYDPLADRWVIVSTRRLERPWQGAVDEEPASDAPAWSADCHLCPGNRRASGAMNPDYAGVFVFDNDFPALAASEPVLDAKIPAPPTDSLLISEPVSGTCRVLCYHPEHHRTLGSLTTGELRAVVDVWSEQQAVLGSDHDWVQIFENRGRMMGASSEHPHGQVWASRHVPSLPAQEDRTQAEYRQAHGNRLLLDYAHHERRDRTRIVAENGSWMVVVPYWAAWPFETLLLPLAPLDDLTLCSETQATDLADILLRLLAAYDRLFGVTMPYSMGWHGRSRTQADHWQLHAHFFPPLLRSATVRKHMVGFEMLAEAQRDLAPEEAALRLRAAMPA